MKPRIQIASASTPDGGEMLLYQHDRDFSIIVNGEDLMHSRRHESELLLARLGCKHLVDTNDATVLIGGLGMGYTLRQTLDLLGPDARVVMSELMDAVIEWNREFLGELNDHPLKDKRVDLRVGDIIDLLAKAKDSFDTIILDIDNGPDAMTYSGNSQLYGYQGITACKTALRNKGCLAIWSARPNKDFEQLVMSCGLHIHRYRVPAHKGKNASSHFIWIASERLKNLPPGGSESKKPSNEDYRKQGKSKKPVKKSVWKK
jgi:spermidine synthase